MRKIFTLFVMSIFALSTFAELAYNTTFTQNDFNSSSTVVKKQGTIEWDTDHVRCGGSSNGISLGGPSWNWDDKYFDVKLANGVPDKLTFAWACNNVTSTQADWYVKESADGTNWSAAIWETTSSNSSWTTVTKELQPTTRYIRFCFSGNFAGNFKNIKVTEKILMGTPSADTLDLGTVYVDDAAAAEFTIGWTNLEATVSSSDAHFTVNPATFGEIGLAYQTQTISVAMNTQAVGEYSSTISIEGRGKSAQVFVSGVVAKHDQTINWNAAETYHFGEVIPVATATSGLTVNYEISNPAVLAFENGAFRILHAGATTVTASQAGNDKYNAATPVVKNITISAPATYGEDFVATTCGEPVVFNDKTYTESTQENVIVGENYMGGDSIVRVYVTINQPSFATDTKTITVGAAETWNGVDLSTYAVGTHTIPFVTTNLVGCDSTVTLTLTVVKASTEEVNVNLAFCAGDSVQYRGVWYKEAGVYTVNVEGAVADSLFTINVTVHETVYQETEKTVFVGENVLFEEDGWLVRGLLPVENGVYATTKADTANLWFVLYTQTEHECEAEYKLFVHVNTFEPVETSYEISFCEGDSAQYRGVWYKEAGEYPVFVEGEVRDTTVNVIVTVDPKAYDFRQQTVLSGYDVLLPDGEWVLGDETYTGYYPTVQSGEETQLTFFLYGQTEKGCEAVLELLVTVQANFEAIDNVIVNEKAEKIFRDGVLYIRRGDKLFTTEGREVK